jgi:hypothetical protein
VTEEDRSDAFDVGPGPSRAAFLIAYLGVVVSGLFGAAIGFGLVDAQCHGGDCTVPKAIGAIVGAICAAVGVGVVAVLALRAMAEWRRPPGSSGPKL